MSTNLSDLERRILKYIARQNGHLNFILLEPSEFEGYDEQDLRAACANLEDKRLLHVDAQGSIHTNKQNLRVRPFPPPTPPMCQITEAGLKCIGKFPPMVR